jgi:hypothetical protein
MMQEITRGFEEGALHPPEVESAPFDEAVRSYDKVAKGEAALKQILTF